MFYQQREKKVKEMKLSCSSKKKMVLLLPRQLFDAHNTRLVYSNSRAWPSQDQGFKKLAKNDDMVKAYS